MGVPITAEIKTREVDKLLFRIKARGGKPPLRRIAVVGTKSINKNFKVGGRPDKWAPLKAGSGKKKRDAEGKFLKAAKHRRAGGKPLRDTASMQKSVHAEYKGRTNVKIVTKHPIAPHHQYGTGTFGKKKKKYWIGPTSKKALKFTASDGSVRMSKGHWHPGIVARPFVGWQEEDATEIQTILADHLTEMDKGGIL